MTAWTFENEPVGHAGHTVTLVEGSSFCISSASGDIAEGAAAGLFVLDTRVLSRWLLMVDDRAPEPLAAFPREPFRATFLSRARRPGKSESTLLVERDRRVGTGLREDISLRNLSDEPVGCVVTLCAGADFADLFQVKEDRVRERGVFEAHHEGNQLRMDFSFRGMSRGVVVHAADASTVNDGEIHFRVVVPARGTWRTTVLVRPVVDGEELTGYFGVERVDEATPVVRHRAWQRESPVAYSDDESLELVLRRSQQDLGALRIFDPHDPGHPVVAAGAPWFMALFGRDSLLSSWMALPLDQTLALGTLQTLAAYQGRVSDPLTEEEPGRILHEVRLGVDSGMALGGGSVYYGTADATPLFVALIGELQLWGVDAAELTPLVPHADAALEWVERYGDRDGDGFVEYQRQTDQGLANQGWKDSWDGVSSADGRLAEPPVALCEVQGYVYAAYLARARLATALGDDDTARRCEEKASRLKQRFNEQFWLPEQGYFAIALDRDKTPLDALASNMGHCLWSGIVDEDKAGSVAERLLSPQMFTGWGVRTLSSDMARYNPMSYHNGSVWPHDSTLAAAGLMRYGHVQHAQRIATGLIEAAARFGGRLPELFCGFDRHEYPQPVPYPTSCSPQAWAAASPLHLVRTLLRFDPAIPGRRVWFAPQWPESFGRLRVERIPLAGSRIAITVDGGGNVENLPDGIALIPAPRPVADEVSWLAG